MLTTGEDARFCDLVNLVNRSYTTPKELGNQNEMKNSHMLSIIEQKFALMIRKSGHVTWSDKDKKATSEGLMKWTTVEMKSRMRATAPLRSASHQRSINHIRVAESSSKIRQKCWYCKNSSHWPGQCHKFAALSVEECLNTAKESNVCFSCLKPAGRRRRQKCTRNENGKECAYSHHPLLHISKTVKVSVIPLSSQREALLPMLRVKSYGQFGFQKQGNVLLDSGAQVSLVREETAAMQGLKGK